MEVEDILREYEKGCGCGSGKPSDCRECLDAAVIAIKRWAGKCDEPNQNAVGTLLEIGARVGDVVEVSSSRGATHTIFKVESGEFYFGPLSHQRLSIHAHGLGWRIVSRAPVATAPKPSKYHRIIRGVTVDIYDMLVAWRVTCPATAHAIKKLMMPGQRGHKDLVADLKEARASIDRAIELAEAKE